MLYANCHVKSKFSFFNAVLKSKYVLWLACHSYVCCMNDIWSCYNCNYCFVLNCFVLIANKMSQTCWFYCCKTSNIFALSKSKYTLICVGFFCDLSCPLFRVFVANSMDSYFLSNASQGTYGTNI